MNVKKFMQHYAFRSCNDVFKFKHIWNFIFRLFEIQFFTQIRFILINFYSKKVKFK